MSDKGAGTCLAEQVAIDDASRLAYFGVNAAAESGQNRQTYPGSPVPGRQVLGKRPGTTARRH
jgi:hypothetical protein